MKEHTAYIGNKVIINNIDDIIITIPKETELFVSSIIYGDPIEHKNNIKMKSHVRWVIKDSPNSLLKKKILYTPVDNLNKIF